MNRFWLDAVLYSALLILMMVACTPPQEGIIQVDSQSLPTVTQRIIYVTPTREPTAIPTFSLVSATPTQSPTPRPTLTPDTASQQAACSAELIQTYTIASESCLGEANGYFCNGGLAPRVEPAGPISSSFSLVGSLVPADVVDMVEVPALLTSNGGGLVWLRLPEPLSVTALGIGHVSLTDVTPPNAGFVAWQSFTVVTHDATSDCATMPPSTLIVQGPYGRSARIVVNGASIELNGTIAIQTVQQQAHFISLEGQARITVFGQATIMFAGQQIRIPYTDTTYTRPSAAANPAEFLTFGDVRNLPIMLLDRPVLLPQPGYAYTDGRVNMRAEPSENARLLYQVPPDEALSILGTNSERTWYHVRLGNSETGWMRADLLKGEIGSVEAVYDSAPLPPERFGNSAHLAMVIAATGGNLREAPDVQFPVIETIPQGSEIELLARSPYSPWVKVSTGTQIGWMALMTIETETVIGFLPIDFDVPLPPGPTATPIFSFGGGHAYPDPRAGQ